MADETKKIILEIQTNEQDVDRLKGKILLLRQEEKKVIKQQKEKGVSQKELNKTTLSYQKTIKTSNDELRKLTKVQNLNKQIVESEKGSYNQLSAQLAKSKLRWRELSREERINSNEGKKLTQQQARLNTELKGTDKTVGVHTRNVGNYSDSLGTIPGPIGRVVMGMKAMNTAAKAFIATPIGLVLAAIALALGALTAHFKSSEEGQNDLLKVTKAFSVVVGNLTDIIAGFGKVIFEAFENPKQSVKELGEFIKTNLINRFKAFAVIGKAIVKIFSEDWKEGLEDLANGTIQLTTGVENVIDKAKEAVSGFVAETIKEAAIAKDLAERQAQLAKNQRKTNEEEARMRVQISQLRLAANDRENVAAEDRIKFLTEAMGLENQILNANQKIAEEKLNLVEIENTLSLSTIEDLNKESALRVALINLEEQNALKKIRLISQLAAAQKEINTELAKEEARVLAEKKAIDDAALALEEERALKDEERTAKELEESEKRLAQTQKESDAKKAAFEAEQAALFQLGVQIGDSAKTAKDAGREVLNILRDEIKKKIQIRLADALTAQLAKVFGTIPFPINIIAAPLAGAGVSLLFNKLIPKFERGADLKGASHANGGIQLFGKGGEHYGEAENGEKIINKKSSAIFHELLSNINSYKGYGVRFQGGGVTTQIPTPETRVIMQPVLVVDDVNEVNLKKQKIIDMETL